MFCKYCGTQLRDGEACQCAASQEPANDLSTVPSTIDDKATEFGSESATLSPIQKILLFIRSHKRTAIAVAALFVLVAILLLSSGNKNKLNGTWVLDKNTLGGGIRLEIGNGTISAQGNMHQYFGQMKYKYEVKSDTELVLRYDWEFSRWPWSFSRASEIPVRYSVNDAGDQLTINWYGTDFVLLDNTDLAGSIGNNGAIVLKKSGPLIFYRKN